MRLDRLSCNPIDRRHKANNRPNGHRGGAIGGRVSQCVRFACSSETPLELKSHLMSDRSHGRSRWMAALSALAIVGGVALPLSAAEPATLSCQTRSCSSAMATLPRRSSTRPTNSCSIGPSNRSSVASRYWHRDFSSPAAYAKSIEPNRARLAQIVGLRETRVPPRRFGAAGHDGSSRAVGQGRQLRDLCRGLARLRRRAGRRTAAGSDRPQLRWPTWSRFPTATNTPEQLVGLAAGVPAESQYARRLAESGCRVIVPVLINREDKKDPLALAPAAVESRMGLSTRPTKWDAG